VTDLRGRPGSVGWPDPGSLLPHEGLT